MLYIRSVYSLSWIWIVFRKQGKATVNFVLTRLQARLQAPVGAPVGAPVDSSDGVVSSCHTGDLGFNPFASDISRFACVYSPYLVIS